MTAPTGHLPRTTPGDKANPTPVLPRLRQPPPRGASCRRAVPLSLLQPKPRSHRFVEFNASFIFMPFGRAEATGSQLDKGNTGSNSIPCIPLPTTGTAPKRRIPHVPPLSFKNPRALSKSQLLEKCFSCGG